MFTFSDRRIIDLLKTRFVPAVGNTHELQNQKSRASEWFLATASRVNPRIAQRVTAQGFYVAAADGSAYGFNNNRDPERVLDFLQRGLRQFAETPPKKVEITAAEIEAAFCKKPDPTLSVLRIFSRIKPLPAGADALNLGVGRDHVWVYPEDVRAIGAERRAEFSMPAAMAARLARYHLVDNVRGEPAFWTPGEVKLASFLVRRQKDGFTFTGRYSMQTEDGARGLEGKMDGTFRVKTEKLEGFRAYGEALAWGSGPYTPRPPAGKFPLKFALVQASDATAQTVPPQAAAYGDGEYRRPR